MITNGFTYVAFLLFFAAMIVFAEKKSKGKFFTYVPAIVLLYFGAMLLSTFGVWDNSNKEITAVYKSLKDNILPAMIFLMLLRCDLRKIVKLGPKMLIGFFSATITIMIGFIITYKVNFLPRNNLDNTYCHSSGSNFCYDSSGKASRLFTAFKSYALHYSSTNSF